MSRTTRDEYLGLMRGRYRRRTGKPARGLLLDEFCQVTGHERKCASKLLSGRRGASGGAGRAGPPGGRPPVYGAAVVAVVSEIWKHSEQPCGKRLKPMLEQWLPAYQRRYGRLPKGVRQGVLAISAAQIDRVLAPRKVGSGVVNRRTPKSNAGIKALVPVRAGCWDAREPGWLEADTVAHCGGDMGGSFLWSLTATDIFSGWTEVRATWNRGQHGVCAAFGEIEGVLPFALLGVDTDNGGEFLNHHLHRHFERRESPVAMTRSRPYHKDDQAHVEQKNSTHVRQLLGFGRPGHGLLVPLVSELLEAWSIWRNGFTTTFKQTSSKRAGSKTVRRHEKVPKTPCQRLIEHSEAGGDWARAAALRSWRKPHDPFDLKDWIEERLSVIWELDAALTLAGSEGESDLGGGGAVFAWPSERSGVGHAKTETRPEAPLNSPVKRLTKQDATGPPGDA